MHVLHCLSSKVMRVSTALLLLSTLAVAVGDKPVVSLKSPEFATLLSLDGGVFRGALQIELLSTLEETIKEVIVEQQLTSFTNTSDFDIYLADYFDVIAGTSIGTYLAAGLTQRSLTPEGRTGPPGNTDTLRQIFEGLANIIESAAQKAQNSTLYNVTGPIASAEAATMLPQIFGNSTLHDFGSFATDFFGTWTNYDGFTAIHLFTSPELEKGGTIIPYITTHDKYDINTRRNFQLWQVARGSGSYPSILYPFNANTTDDTPAADKLSVMIGDGCITSQDPTIAAIPYMLRVRQDPLPNLRVLSIGSAAATPPPATVDQLAQSIQDWNFAWWSSVGNKYPSVGAMGTMLNAVHPNSKVAPYLRIDVQVTLQECGLITGPKYNCTERYQAVMNPLPQNIPVFTEMGQNLAAEFKDDIKEFVEQFLVHGAAQFLN